MGNEIPPIQAPSLASSHPAESSLAPVNTQENNSQEASHSKASQASQDQLRQAENLQKAQEAQEAQLKKASSEVLRIQTQSASFSQDFLQMMDSIVKEGYETAKPPEGGKTGDQNSGNAQQNPSFPSQKELQLLREFMREANYLIQNQNMEVAQMLNTLKVEQGGAFWQKVQQMLQKGIPLHQAVVFQSLDKNLQEISKQFLGMEGMVKMAATSGSMGAGEALQIQPGRALLEIMKAESNPQGAMDHYLVALQILLKDGMQGSAQKLLSYLRRRGGFKESEQAYFLGDQLRRDLVGPSSPREERSMAHLWYILIAMGSFGALVGLGFDWIASLLVGFSMGLVIFIFSFIYKK